MHQNVAAMDIQRREIADTIVETDHPDIAMELLDRLFPRDFLRGDPGLEAAGDGDGRADDGPQFAGAVVEHALMHGHGADDGDHDHRHEQSPTSKVSFVRRRRRLKYASFGIGTGD